MAIEDFIKPLDGHKPGFPKQIVGIIKNLNMFSHDMLKFLAEESYHRLLEMIDRGLSGQGVKVDEEEMAALYVSHLIVDAAILHNACRRAEINVGSFPYDYLADRLIPHKKEKELLN